MENHNILSWNVRGINKREKQRSLRTFCYLNKIGIGAFLETKLRGNKIEEMMTSHFVGWNHYTGSANEGRILLVWQANIVSVEVLQDSDQFIHAYVKELGSSKEFCLSFVYGRNTIDEQLQLWQDLSRLSFPVNPWLVAGDFTAVFYFNDRLGGRDVAAMEMVDAQRWRSIGLVDELRTCGSHYTWSNKQAAEARIYSKLDRIFKNEAWLDLFPQSEAYVNWDMIYDHCFCVIKTITTLNLGIKPFRFFNMWADHEGFRETVLQNWIKPIKAHGLERIMRQLVRLKHILRKFNIREIGDVVHKYTVAKENYQSAQCQLQKDPYSANLQREERSAFGTFSSQSRYYDSYLRQKSKIN
ncbi:uncharacterized protein LOC133785504 [Humulus lupulus]|uniref:uncharacterized protein LOC133785504 n=1 Tax=Humulus lupulus TaxID=3486 RepID=UPI002B401CFB|nr:uncharacterized protein LOC133785504 [Humulus lupulus]